MLILFFSWFHGLFYQWKTKGDETFERQNCYFKNQRNEYSTYREESKVCGDLGQLSYIDQISTYVWPCSKVDWIEDTADCQTLPCNVFLSANIHVSRYSLTDNVTASLRSKEEVSLSILCAIINHLLERTSNTTRDDLLALFEPGNLVILLFLSLLRGPVSLPRLRDLRVDWLFVHGVKVEVEMAMKIGWHLWQFLSVGQSCTEKNCWGGIRRREKAWTLNGMCNLDLIADAPNRSAVHFGTTKGPTICHLSSDSTHAKAPSY